MRCGVSFFEISVRPLLAAKTTIVAHFCPFSIARTIFLLLLRCLVLDCFTNLSSFDAMQCCLVHFSQKTPFLSSLSPYIEEAVPLDCL